MKRKILLFCALATFIVSASYSQVGASLDVTVSNFVDSLKIYGQTGPDINVNVGGGKDTIMNWPSSYSVTTDIATDIATIATEVTDIAGQLAAIVALPDTVYITNLPLYQQSTVTGSEETNATGWYIAGALLVIVIVLVLKKSSVAGPTTSLWIDGQSDSNIIQRLDTLNARLQTINSTLSSINTSIGSLNSTLSSGLSSVTSAINGLPHD